MSSFHLKYTIPGLDFTSRFQWKPNVTKYQNSLIFFGTGKYMKNILDNYRSQVECTLNEICQIERFTSVKHP